MNDQQARGANVPDTRDAQAVSRDFVEPEHVASSTEAQTEAPGGWRRSPRRSRPRARRAGRKCNGAGARSSLTSRTRALRLRPNTETSSRHALAGAQASSSARRSRSCRERRAARSAALPPLVSVKLLARLRALGRVEQQHAQTRLRKATAEVIPAIPPRRRHVETSSASPTGRSGTCFSFRFVVTYVSPAPRRATSVAPVEAHLRVAVWARRRRRETFAIRKVPMVNRTR